jgi:hypothetical protein
MTSLYLPFVKVIHALSMSQFLEYDFSVNNNTLLDDGDIQSMRKQMATNLDSAFISYHPNGTYSHDRIGMTI